MVRVLGRTIHLPSPTPTMRRQPTRVVPTTGPYTAPSSMRSRITVAMGRTMAPWWVQSPSLSTTVASHCPQGSMDGPHLSRDLRQRLRRTGYDHRWRHRAHMDTDTLRMAATMPSHTLCMAIQATLGVPTGMATPAGHHPPLPKSKHAYSTSKTCQATCAIDTQYLYPN